MALGHWNQGTADMTGAAVTLFTALAHQCTDLFFSILPGTNNLTALTIEARLRPLSDTWMTLANAAADFTAPSGAIFGASGDLTTLAADSEGWCKVKITADWEIRVRATAAVRGTVDWEFSVT